MITDELKRQILLHFGFTPTPEQDKAISVLSLFLTDHDPRSVMIFRGSAGTGKTTLAGAVVQTLLDLNAGVVLMAPTGRAAKVFSVNSGHAAYTVHRCIYREQSYQGISGTFNLGFNRYRHTLFMVDEASMIYRQAGFSGTQVSDSNFGSGSLLDDLIQYVYSAGSHDRLILIGDQAQLAPIGEDEAPALSASAIEAYGLKVYQCDLNEVLRQKQGSGILCNALNIRKMILAISPMSGTLAMPEIHFKGFADVSRISGEDFVEQLSSSYAEVGIDETIVITRSNKRANAYNQGIRNQVLGMDDELCNGDRIMIVKNNYYWMAQKKKDEPQPQEFQDQSADVPHGIMSHLKKEEPQVQGNQLNFLANGDRAEVERVRHFRDLYGFHFADVDLKFPDYDDQDLSATVIMDSLTTETPSLAREQSDQLFEGVMEDYRDVPRKADRMNKLREDAYFNALQVKFAYAVTCHKAQGGQWDHVYLDQGYMTQEMISPAYLHWLYTAITRAKKKLYLINWPESQTADAEDR
nr:ATP-dependent helicase [uncultured Prevotella sp.]